MKRIKKFASLMLAVIMVLAMGITAFAEEEVKITVNTTNPENTEKNERTYNYYKIFDATLVDPADAEKGVSYYLTSGEQEEALSEVTVDGKKVFSFTQSADGSRWVVAINESIDFDDATEAGKANAVALAEALKAVVDDNTDLFSESADFGAGQAQSVVPGYYLIVSSLGTKMMLDTFETQSITEKNEYPSNTKTENKETASIGEEVTYTVEVNIPPTVAEEDIVVVDTISKGLTMNTAIAVAGDKEADETKKLTVLQFTENTAYVSANGEKQYKATIPAATVKANAGNILTLTYTATVNKDAVVNVPETNDAHIEYDNFVSKDIKVQVKTHGFTVRKIDGADVTDEMKDEDKLGLKALEGAEFTLWDAATEGNEIKVVAVDADGNVIAANNSNTAVAKYRVAENGTEEEQAVNIKVGEATIEGLAAGTYYLQEEKAPNGYNMLTERQEITVSEETSAVGVDIAVENKTGSLLPSTGGIGTTIFYVVGGILVVGAAILLVAKKRMGSHK